MSPESNSKISRGPFSPTFMYSNKLPMSRANRLQCSLLKMNLRQAGNFRMESITPFGSCRNRGAFYSQKISYTFGKNPFVLKENPSKIRVNLFVQKKSRTLFLMSEVPLRRNDRNAKQVVASRYEVVVI